MKKLGIGLAVFGLAVVTSLASVSVARAVTPPPGPASGSVGVEGTIPSPAPTQAATIVQPANGQSFGSGLITVSGSCPNGTIVKVFSNGIFVGSAVCTNGTYILQISLFPGRNDLVARVFDALDQQGPDSNVVTVDFNDAQFAQFGSHVLITSQYARRAAAPSEDLEWPVIISGGIGPYAISIDWGDGTTAELHSEPFAGSFNYKHVYKASGIYKVTFTVVDSNDTSAFLQVIAVATGTINSSTSTSTKNENKTVVVERKIIWEPMVILILLSVLTFWLGRRYELTALRRRIEREFE